VSRFACEVGVEGRRCSARTRTTIGAVPTVVIAVLAAASLLAAGCTKSAIVRGHSMEPALTDGQSVPVTMELSAPTRGDVIAFRFPRDTTKSFLQRVVGLPGETIQIVGGHVQINGQPLDEPYVADGNWSSETLPAVHIPPDEYYVLGDNRRNSSDSRSWGLVKRDLIWGRLVER
jgi:signal peptidase I